MTSHANEPRCRIALLGGDGIGPEVTHETKLLLELLRDRHHLPLDLYEFDVGADRTLTDGVTLPDEVRAFLRADRSVVFLGAVGDSRIADGHHAREILMGLRQDFDLYANVRPIRAPVQRVIPLKDKTIQDIDFVVIRENTEGSYVSVGGQFKFGTPDEIAITEDINTRKGVERILRFAFDLATTTPRRTLHMADKSNAMRHAHGLWRRVFEQVAREYPNVQSEAIYADTLCLQLVRQPEQFNVIVTSNFIGDLITDLGAALIGGLGMAPSANLRSFSAPGPAVFEPVHGSAPELKGKDLANPFASFRTAGMLLSYFGFVAEQLWIEQAIVRALDTGPCTPDVGGNAGTCEVSCWVRDEISRRLS